MPDHLDITDISPREPARPTPSSTPFLQVEFACCKSYQRVYRSPDGQTYQGRCPRCGKPVKFVVGEGGTNSRSFVVY